LHIIFHFEKTNCLAVRRDQVDLQSKRLLVNRQAGKYGNATWAPIYGGMSPWFDVLLTKGETISPSTQYLLIDDHGNQITDLPSVWNNTSSNVKPS
jgi:hypothetical protein